MKEGITILLVEVYAPAYDQSYDMRVEEQTSIRQLMEEMAVLRATAAQIDALPGELVAAVRKGSFGASALVRHPQEVRRLLPGAVLDRFSIDEMMQFYAGREEEA